MSPDDAQCFAEAWISVWNDHDLKGILEHYADDVVFYSPMISRVLGEPVSSVSGKAALEAYWRRALSLAPDLHFDLSDVYAGAASLTIHYKNQRGRPSAETFVFGDAGKVTLSIATYGKA